jgi:phage terminase Nu1 subunit (DNA packaging protein)
MAVNVKKDISDVIVSTDVMAELLGFTRQRVNQLAKEGVLEKQAPGRFLLRKNIKKYIDYLRINQADEEEEGATAQYWEEKALHEKAKREMAELKLARQRNQLHDAADVEFALTNMLATFRNRILGIPGKLAPQLLGVDSLAELQELIDKELREALTELSEYDPAMFAGGEVIEEEDDEAISENIDGGSASAKVDNK